MTGALEKEFEQYYCKYCDKAYRGVLSKINNAALAEDIVQSAFLSCYEKFEEFDPQKASFGTWLNVIINNRLKNYYRDRKESTDIDDVDLSDGGFEDEITQAMYMERANSNLAAALELLKDRERLVIIYKYFKKKPDKEVAEILNISHANVRVIHTRALDSLRKIYEEKNYIWER